MTISNEQIAKILEDLADILEGQDENPYRIRAYRRAAKSLKKHKQNLSDYVKDNKDLTLIPNIGTKLAALIKEIIITGTVPPPKILGAIPYLQDKKKFKRKAKYIKYYSLEPFIEKIINILKTFQEVSEVECTGDYRRKKEVVGEIIILMVTNKPKVVFQKFHELTIIKYLIETKLHSTFVQLKNGVLIRLVALKEDLFAAKLLAATGSPEHYQLLRNTAKKNGLKLLSSGLVKNKKKVPTKSELEIYQTLKLSYIPPELRENRGEITAAQLNQLPNLIELSDIKGDLHCHTNSTDGSYSLIDMVAAAQEHGYEYVAITDHSQSLKITHGMNEERLLEQIKKIDSLNETFKNFVILKSMEIDILEDGNLDLDVSLLKELDITICSIHSKFHLPVKQQTERIIRAMDNPYFNILGHPTGRLIHRRPPYGLDLPRIFQAAKERNCFIELNSQPARLDINDIHCKYLKEIGVKISISSDAHSVQGFNFMKLGVNQARRGWLEAKDVINTYSLTQLRKLIKRKW